VKQTRVIVFVLLSMLFVARTASAQLVVFDPLNLIQTILIAERTERQYEELVQEYQLILRMAQNLGNMDAYRIPSIAISRHDASRWEFGRPWIQGLNTGDAAGTAYLATAQPLLPLTVDAGRVSPAARTAIQRDYATIEIADSVAEMGGHQVALVRGYHDRIQRAVQSLEGDVLNGLLRYHQLTANLDKVAAGELLGRRQDMAANQLLSHVLEQLLVRTKRARDAEASTINMQLVTWRDGATANAAFTSGTATALSTWRQP
jgi:hypothetical protein